MGILVSSKLVLSPEVNRLFTTLSDHHRRLILMTLREDDVLQEADVMARTTQSEEAIKIQLTHNHLPKLVEAEYIEWDEDAGEISTGPNFEEIEPFLELMEKHADELPPD